jgi:iron complex transport system ATP-binding protein
MTSLLEAQGVRVAARLHPTDLRCEQGETVAVIGPNGAGKTSLLRALCGIDIDGGSVRIDGEDVAGASPARRMRFLSFLPASRAILWPISARDAVALGLPSPEPARIDELVELLELEPLADRPINSLSTGERSRVLLARALAARPRLLLLDEPLSNLDPYWVLKCLEILRDAARQTGCAVLASVHDLSQVAAFSRAVLISGGAIAADGTPGDVLGSPALEQAFRIRRADSGWAISPEAGRRSSP